jgi:hypothetical protein
MACGIFLTRAYALGVRFGRQKPGDSIADLEDATLRLQTAIGVPSGSDQQARSTSKRVFASHDA